MQCYNAHDVNCLRYDPYAHYDITSERNISPLGAIIRDRMLLDDIITGYVSRLVSRGLWRCDVSVNVD